MSMDNVFHTNSRGPRPSFHTSKGSWEIPPLSFDPTKASVNSDPNSVTDSLRKPAITHNHSQISVADSQGASSLAGIATKLASPTPAADDDEQAVLKEAGLIMPDSPTSKLKRPETPSDAGRDQDHDSIKSPDMSISSENRPKVRRSLQRTLRESHHSGHHRNKKGKVSFSGFRQRLRECENADSKIINRTPRPVQL